MYFAEVLNIIGELNSHSVTATEEVIVGKLREIKDGLNSDRIQQIPDLLQYACNVSYISNLILNNVSAYKLNNDLEFSTICDLCGESLEPFICDNFRVNSHVNFVDRATFEELARNLNDFKQYINNALYNLQNNVKSPELERSTLERNLRETQKRNKELEKDIKDKEILINLLVKNISGSSTNVLERDKSIGTDLIFERDQQEILKNINEEFITFRKPAKAIPTQFNKDIQLANRFNDLYINDKDDNDDDNEDDNDDVDNEYNNGNVMNTNVVLSAKNVTKVKKGFKRPTNIINNYPERDDLFIPKRNQIIPGASTYSNITKQGKNICIISDSITQRINMKEFNYYVENANVYKKVFPGATVEEIEHYTVKILESKNIDAVILNVGINNIKSKHSTVKTETDITTKIIKIVTMCREAGVNDVFVSGITCIPLNEKKVRDINELLKLNARQLQYIFIDNQNIVKEKHLWKDKMHLNRDGLNILANNFIESLNNVFRKH